MPRLIKPRAGILMFPAGEKTTDFGAGFSTTTSTS